MEEGGKGVWMKERARDEIVYFSQWSEEIVEGGQKEGDIRKSNKRLFSYFSKFILWFD